MKLSWHRFELEFKRRIGTSRGSFDRRSIYVLSLEGQEGRFTAECAPLEGLSPEALEAGWQENYERKLRELCGREFEDVLSECGEIAHSFPSMGFALESLSAQLEQAEEGLLFDSDYSRGREGLPINGLVWMGDRKFERTQAFDLINKGFRCLKFKIGAEYFAHSAPLLREIREFDAGLEMRVDANGAFEAETAYKLMLDLRELGIHSIEQPLRPEAEGEWIDLIRNAPIPVALDESLIGRDPADSFDWLRAMNPHYLILKPTLIGGFKRCDQWIESANRLEMGYWFTSMLESPLGLDAVAQYAAARRNSRPDVAFQGLGTGSIYRGDLPFKSGWSPMVEGAELWRRKAIQ